MLFRSKGHASRFISRAAKTENVVPRSLSLFRNSTETLAMQATSFQKYLQLILGQKIMFVYVAHNIQIFAKFIANILNAMLPQILDVQKFINM